MLAEFGWFVLGLLALTLGADSLLKGLSGLALRLGVSGFAVGLMAVLLGTSLPELSVNMSAMAVGAYDITLGNVVGSNALNVGLTLGLAALSAPLYLGMRALGRGILVLIAASVLLWGLVLDGGLSRTDGAILLGAGLLALILILRGARDEPIEVQRELAAAADTRKAMGLNVLRLIVGIALMLYGADLLVAIAGSLSRAYGVSELMMGLTAVALATALPEIVLATLAARRGQGNVVAGTVVGANLFNVLVVLGLAAAAHPFPVARGLVHVEIPALIAFAAVLYPIVRGDAHISRREGAILVLGYLALLGYQLHLMMR
jgi:cation:H+ antiporter